MFDPSDPSNPCNPSNPLSVELGAHELGLNGDGGGAEL
jgi:hypothetical protein